MGLLNSKINYDIIADIMQKKLNDCHILSIAPMVDWTYSHFRVLMRILAPNSLLYTEMLTADAIINNPDKCLFYNPIESPLAVQLGGSDRYKLAKAAKIAESLGFAEINLNLGCPSQKVQSGKFGACLMLEKNLVKDCIMAIKDSVQIPVSAKTRIGVDRHDDYNFFEDFANMLITSGCNKLIVHARKAWLKGLNPKQNRTIPQINYNYVYKLKEKNPNMPIVINGDIKNYPEIQQHLKIVDGIMLGRLAYENPYAILKLHNLLYPQMQILTRKEILRKYFIEINMQTTNLSLVLKPLYNLYHGENGASQWKQTLLKTQQTKIIDLSDLFVNSL